MSEPFQVEKRPTTFVASLGYALNGLLHAIVHQRNMRMHVISAVLVSLVGAGVSLGLAEKVTLIFCVMLIFFAEMLNSALEQLVDLATTEIDRRAGLAKDMAAAGVLVLATGTVVVFAAILVHDAGPIFADLAAIERQVAAGVPLTFFAGALMHEQKKPAWLDAIFTLGALVCWGFTVSWTKSEVFSAMTLALIGMCAASGIYRRRTTQPTRSA